MESNSHYGKIIDWIEGLVNSCETIPHLKTCQKIIILFENRIRSDKNVKVESYEDMSNSLKKIYNLKQKKLLCNE